MPSARRAPREVLPSTATALNRPRASVLACWAARRARYLRTLAEAGRRGAGGRAGAARAGPGPGPAGRGGPAGSGSSSHPEPGTGLPSGPTGRAAGPGRPGWPALPTARPR